MSSRFLKDLFPKTVTFEGINYVLLKDKNIVDTETITPAETQQEFFTTKTAKLRSEANFFGDQSLVREKNLFMVLQLSIYPRFRILTATEWFTFYHFGFFEMKVVEPEKVTVDEDRLVTISPHLGPEQFDSGFDAVVPSGRNAIDRRTYLINENKFVPGGRSFEFVVNWVEAEGNGLLINTEFCVEIYGAEYERKGKMA
jgi:hypothetical protein